jgi:DNA-binding winged helix-turn-helix (wHTH) protein
VTFEFGPLQLDEPSRVLRLSGREVAVQPRIFDLLAYLLRHRQRVVPKDELLDALWPGVTVTDNSLQRAVSVLRAVLRPAGLEDAVRNVPRAGYRFGFDVQPAGDLAGPGLAHGEDLGEARAALAAQCWVEAADRYAAVDGRDPLSGEDLDGWALALQCLGRPSDAIALLVRAVSAHSDGGSREAAAASATTLAGIHLERGEAAVAAGWLARARDLVSDGPETAATGLILWMQSRLAAAEAEPETALALAEAAYDIGRRVDDVRVTALGLMYRGFFRLSLGRTREGLADQDHAAALALSNKLDPMTGGVLYCNVLWACRTFGDWSRANQWTLSYQEFCSLAGMRFSGSCQLHRAEVLGVQGTLDEALAHVTQALSRLDSDAPWALGDAHRVIGDIHAAMGNRAAAHQAYQSCYDLGWSPEPGHAMLLLEEGEPQAALASLERSLIGRSWWTLQRQGMLLAHLAVVAAHAGERARAEELIGDLAGQEDRWPMPSIRALTNEAAALLARQAGDSHGTLRHLHLARQLWTSIGARLEAARLRLTIAECLIEDGDGSGAETEVGAACAAAESLDSDRLREGCRALRRRLSREPSPRPGGTSP